MMKFLSPWRRGGVSFQSLLWLNSASFPGVRFAIRKISLAQRIEFSKQVRDLTLRNEFLRAGEVTDQLEASMADLLVQKLYLTWAVAEITGMTIDGAPASVELLIERGPEALVQEIGDTIRLQIELSDVERKNS